MRRCRATASSRSSSSTIARSRAPRRCRGSSASRRSPKRSARAPRSATRRIAGAWRCSISRAARRCGRDSTASAIRSRFRSRRVGDEPRAGRRSRIRRRSATCAGASPMLSPDGTQRGGRRCAPPTTPSAGSRWSIRRPARRKVLDHLKDDAWIASTAAAGLAARQQRVWFLAEHDGWMHLYTVDATAASPARKQLTTRDVRNRLGRAVAGRHARSTSSRPKRIPASATSTR